MGSGIAEGRSNRTSQTANLSSLISQFSPLGSLTAQNPKSLRLKGEVVAIGSRQSQFAIAIGSLRSPGSDSLHSPSPIPRFLFPAFGGLLYGYDIGVTSSSTISLQENDQLCKLVQSGVESGARLIYLMKETLCYLAEAPVAYKEKVIELLGMCGGWWVKLCFYSQNSEDLESGFSSDVESKYKKIYEDDINPFAAFSKKILKHEWPARWRSFIPDLVAAGKTSETICENCMAILKLLSEEVFDFSRGEMTQQKIKELKQSLNRE